MLRVERFNQPTRNKFPSAAKGFVRYRVAGNGGGGIQKSIPPQITNANR